MNGGFAESQVGQGLVPRLLVYSLTINPLVFSFHKMASFKTTYKYLVVILLGFIIFLVDFYEVADPITSEIVLFIISILKAGYFIYFVFRKILF